MVEFEVCDRVESQILDKIMRPVSAIKWKLTDISVTMAIEAMVWDQIYNQVGEHVSHQIELQLRTLYNTV